MSAITLTFTIEPNLNGLDDFRSKHERQQEPYAVTLAREALANWQYEGLVGRVTVVESQTRALPGVGLA
jgi:hypothetical protein